MSLKVAYGSGRHSFRAGVVQRALELLTRLWRILQEARSLRHCAVSIFFFVSHGANTLTVWKADPLSLNELSFLPVQNNDTSCPPPLGQTSSPTLEL